MGVLLELVLSLMVCLALARPESDEKDELMHLKSRESDIHHFMRTWMAFDCKR